MITLHNNKVSCSISTERSLHIHINRDLCTKSTKHNKHTDNKITNEKFNVQYLHIGLNCGTKYKV